MCKDVSVLSLASHYEDPWGNGGTAPRILNLGNGCEYKNGYLLSDVSESYNPEQTYTSAPRDFL
jgi:hypothetical protein